jgi:hypothetical protein
MPVEAVLDYSRPVDNFQRLGRRAAPYELFCSRVEQCNDELSDLFADSGGNLCAKRGLLALLAIPMTELASWV